MLSNFRVLNMAYELHKGCQELKLKGPLRGQLERASLSVALNTAEGNGRLAPDDRKRFFGYALGSLRESQAALHIAGETKYLELSNQIGAILYKLAR